MAALGAVMIGAFDWELEPEGDWPDPEYRAALACLAECCSLSGDVEAWNDHPRTTLADALDVFHKAVLLAKSNGW